ncbi:MAG TPA: glycosyltransferase [Pyrinomonadaceae bacterium]|nr:glycosyltransferase [Pyrinomonadaceae bacterium]
MIYVYYFFAAILIWLSLKAFRSGIDYARFIRERVAAPVAEEQHFATIFAPCRGVDPGFSENLERLFLQEYREYEIIFIVDDEKDEAVQPIVKAIAKFANPRVSAKLLVAPKAKGTSQKIANLLHAIPHADERSVVFAFVDSDARTGSAWLASLSKAALEAGVGAATGYRWLVSERWRLGSALASVWNASVASALGRNTKTNFCWGGSMAVSRTNFEKLGVREHWQGALSDDFAVTRAVRNAGLAIEFVPCAMCASLEDRTIRDMLEFTTRQMKITRVYSPGLWIMSMIGSAVFCGVLLASVCIVFASEPFSVQFALALGVFVAVAGLTAGKALMRLNAVRLSLAEYDTLLRMQFLSQTALSFLTPVVFLVNSIAALLSRRIAWRGTIYELNSPSETVIIREKR